METHGGYAILKEQTFCLEIKGHLEIIWLIFFSNLDSAERIKHTWKVTNITL